MHCTAVSLFLKLDDRVLVKQGCDECSFAWGMSKELHEATVGKIEAHINRSMMTFKGSARHWNYLETPIMALSWRTLGSEGHRYAIA